MTRAWIEFARDRPHADRRVVCIPYAGGSARVFQALAESMPEDIEFGAVQLPGRWNRAQEGLLTDVLEVAEALARELAQLPPVPYALFGYSLGGLIAFETARFLARVRAQEPTALIVAACRAPKATPPLPLLHELADNEFIEAILERYPGGIPALVLEAPDVLAMLLPILRADLQMFETYRYVQGAPLRCPIYAFAGDQDSLNPPSSMHDWRDETAGDFCLETVAGGHFFINTSHSRLRTTISRSLLLMRQ